MGRFFVVLLRLAGALIFVTGGLKLVTIFGDTELLRLPDPIFGLSFRTLFFVAAVAELVVGAFAVVKPKSETAQMLLLALGSAIMVYRLGLYYVDYRKPCTCLGSLTAILGISEEIADFIAKCILTFVICVSVANVAVKIAAARRAKETELV